MLNDGNKELPPERYDARLFQQAYKAGLKAKELDKENAKRKRSKNIFYIRLSFLSSLLFSFFLSRNPKKTIFLLNKFLNMKK